MSSPFEELPAWLRSCRDIIKKATRKVRGRAHQAYCPTLTRSAWVSHGGAKYTVHEIPEVNGIHGGFVYDYEPVFAPEKLVHFVFGDIDSRHGNNGPVGECQCQVCLIWARLEAMLTVKDA